MLIDLPDPVDTDRTKFSKIAVEGGWRVHATLVEVPPEWTPEQRADVTDVCIYQRLQLGVYVGSVALAAMYSGFREIYSFEWQKPLHDELTAAAQSGDRDRHQAALDALNEEFAVPEYGRADDLEQILASGRRYVDGPHSYVLEVHAYDNTDEKRHKAGPYIGTLKAEAAEENGWCDREPAEVVAFRWIRLASAKSSEADVARRT